MCFQTMFWNYVYRADAISLDHLKSTTYTCEWETEKTCVVIRFVFIQYYALGLGVFFSLRLLYFNITTFIYSYL